MPTSNSILPALPRVLSQRFARGMGCLCFLLALTTAPALADTVTSVSCSTPTAPYASGATSCYEAGSYGYTQASVSSSISLPASASDSALISASSSATALQGYARGFSEVATGQSAADVGIIFDTTGAERSGYLELNFLQTAWQVPANGNLSESLTIGSYTASPDGANLVSIWIPIELGTQFGFDYVESLTAIGSSGSGLTTADIGAQISLQAFEADGTTPVQLFDPPGNPGGLLTPEPGEIGLMLAGVGCLAVFLGIRRRLLAK